MRADHLECSGKLEGAKPGFTPNLDGLAARGVRFENAFANAAWTLPSHASLFTGQEPHIHGQSHAAVVEGVKKIRIKEEATLRGRFTTLAAALREVGYQTLGLSQNTWVGSISSQDHGFDRFWELWLQDQSKLPFPPQKGDDLELHKVTYAARHFMDNAYDTDRPLFLFVNYITCHLPYQPAWSFRSRFVRGFPPEELLEVTSHNWLTMQHEGTLGDKALPYLRNLYLAEVAEVDAAVGQLAGLLKARGLLDNTLFIVTSDHGECLGQHGFFDHQFNLYDDLLRVPLTMSHPKLPGGSKESTPVQLSDLLPTVLHMVGAEAQQKRLALPGRIMPLDGKSGGTGSGGDRPLFFQFRRGSLVLAQLKSTLPADTVARLDRDLFAVRHGAWKAILTSDGEFLVFNTEKDAGEEQNQATQDKDRARALLALLKDHYGGKGLPFPEKTAVPG